MNWNKYSTDTIRILKEFRCNEIDMKTAFAKVDELSEMTEPKIHQYVTDSISEIDSSIEEYDELIENLETLSQIDFLKYIDC